jgi:SAM-dependent methyltransferase
MDSDHATHGHQHRHGQHHEHAQGADDDLAMAALLDLDAEVLHQFVSDVLDQIAVRATAPPRRILDLGAGTGAGALALLQRYPTAEAVAVDQAAAMLRHLEGKAAALGVADRVRTVEADLDGPWTDVGVGADPADLIWASASLHHLADPDRVLTDLLGALEPGGLLVAIELDSFPRFLPDDIGIGRPGLEARCHALLAEQRIVDMPHLGDDWGIRLARAGFVAELEWPVAIELTAPLPPAAQRYAQITLRRMRAHLADALDADDLASLDSVIESDGPEGVLRREDLSVRANRTVWMGRRP